MKKLLFGLAALFLLTSCVGKRNSEKTREDSARVADSIAQVEAAKAVVEQARQDSILLYQINEEYQKGLILTTGNIKGVNAEGTYNELTMKFIVENNTNITWDANDYNITFKVKEEYQIEESGDLDVKWFNRKAKGKTVRPGEKITIIHKDSGWYPKDIKIKPNLDKEEFTTRFKENTVFDPQLDMFVEKPQEK